MRDHVHFYLNGVSHTLHGEEAFMQLADWLRYKKGLTGTKIVCAEGDCGACTVLVSRLVNKKMTAYQSINSCISFMYLLDRCHIITVEGLAEGEKLHPAQQAMIECNGAQCGYCTPGFVCALAGLADEAKSGKQLNDKHVKNALTGNLCRCTGYDDIIKAGMSMDLSQVTKLTERYHHDHIEKELLKLSDSGVTLESAHKKAFLPGNLLQAIQAPAMKVTSGATDLGVLSNKGKLKVDQTMSLNNVGSMYEIREEKDFVLIGA